MKKLRTTEVQEILAVIQFSIISSHLLSHNVKIKVYMTTVLLLVLYGCESWLRVLDSRVLRGIFEPNREEVTRGWRKLHNEELCNVYS
jgi:hypothetical protein